MWINKIVYMTLVTAWNEQVAELRREIEASNANLVTFDDRIHGLRTDNDRLRERLIAAEGHAKSAQAMRDLLVIQNSQLQEERGQFLQKILDPMFRPTIRVPKISHGPTIQPPGVDFEDMGDAQAKQYGYSDEIPVDQGEHVLEPEEPITGLSGVAYDPASELGAELPRLGDDPGSAPDM